VALPLCTTVEYVGSFKAGIFDDMLQNQYTSQLAEVRLMLVRHCGQACVNLAEASVDCGEIYFVQSGSFSRFACDVSKRNEDGCCHVKSKDGSRHQKSKDGFAAKRNEKMAVATV